MAKKVWTVEELTALTAENAAAIKELTQDVKELRQSMKELAESHKETDRQIAKMRLETDRHIAATDKSIEELRQSRKETDRQIAAIHKELGGIGENNGLVAEEIVCHSLAKNMTFAGTVFDRIEVGRTRGIKLPGGERVKGEYDVVLSNGTTAAIIEVKYRVGKNALDRLVTVQLPRFRVVFPEYKDFKMYLGLGGMSFENGVEEEALRLGIATLRLNGEAVEINDANVKAW